MELRDKATDTQWLIPGVIRDIDEANAFDRVLQTTTNALHQRQETLAAASESIRTQWQKLDSPLKGIYADYIFWERQVFPGAPGDSELLWLTFNPEQIFPHTLYHVTASTALDDLAEGNTLIPPGFHAVTGTVTHRGAGLTLASELLTTLQIPLGGKDMMIWAGTTIDQEQIALEQSFGANQATLDDELKTLMLRVTRYSTDGRPIYDLHPALVRTLDLLKAGKPLSTIVKRRIGLVRFQQSFFS